MVKSLKKFEMMNNCKKLSKYLKYLELLNQKAEKYMSVSTSPVGMLNVKVDGIGILQKTFKNSNWKKWRI